MTLQSVNIIGAGLSGITLGRALLKRGIQPVLYERASSASRHGYGITLHESSYRPLLKVLDIDEQTFKNKVAVDGAVGGTGAIDPKRLVHSGDVTASSFRAHREKLEILIRQGLDIRWGNELEKLESSPNGTIISLRNGQRIEAEGCVVGAEGPHSNARKSLLPRCELKVLPFVTFNGKRRVKRSTFDELYAPTMNGSNIVESRKGSALLQVSVNDISDDVVSISWVYSRAAKGITDVCFKPNRPLAKASDIPEEFYEEVVALRDLAQPYKEVFDEPKLRTDRVLAWLMRTVEIDPSALTSIPAGVILMGDSAHAQAILGGEGANVAIADGLTLAEHIASTGNAAGHDWYTERMPTWQQSLQRSKVVIEAMHREQNSVL